MHQLLCGVDETLLVDGYRIEILEVTEDGVTFGLSTGESDRTIHAVQLAVAGVEQTTTTPDAADPPAVP